MQSLRVLIILTAVMVAADAAMAAAALWLACDLRFNWLAQELVPSRPGIEEYASLGAVQVVTVLGVFATRGLYRVRRNASRVDELQRVFVGVALAALLTVGMMTLVTKGFPYSRAVALLAWMLSVPMIWLARLLQFWFHGRLRRAGVGAERVLLVGCGPVASAVWEKIRGAPDWGYQVVGLVAGEVLPEEPLPEAPVLGNVADIGPLVDRTRATEVIIADPALSHQQIVDIVQRLDHRRVSIRVFPDVFQLISTQVSLSDLHGLPLVSIRDASLRGWRFAVKRVVDIVVSCVALVLLSPLLLLIAFAIKLSEPRQPVFYVQERVGMDGRPLWVFKFRSMRTGAEEATGPVWARPNDPRATPLGRLLRRFSLDELPQFVNVLLGDMSLVGPRPERPHFVRQFSRRIPDYWKRHWEKAGLTGWAQVNGLRGDTSIEERTAYDLWYVENWNLWLDFKIILRTIPALFRENNG